MPAPRICYLLVHGGDIQGGHKMVIRHVETLRSLGFNAVCQLTRSAPTWLEHSVPFTTTPPHPEDVVVVADDTIGPLEDLAQRDGRTVVFCQNPYYFASSGAFHKLDLFPPHRRPEFIAVAPRLRQTVGRLFPDAPVHLVPCFADERLFHPRGPKIDRVVYCPRKRRVEAAAVFQLFRRLHVSHRDLRWSLVDQASERTTAEAFAGSTIFLSLSRLESVGMTPLEAMASGCVVAGFPGRGGLEYASPDNGFWVEDDDCEGAADAVAAAAELVAVGGDALRSRLEAGYETARQWSYQRFRTALEDVWMKIAPECRLQSTPLECGA